MELGLSLGDPPKPLGFVEKHHRDRDHSNNDKASPFCMDLSIGPLRSRGGEENGRQDELNSKEQQRRRDEISQIEGTTTTNDGKSGSSSEPPVQLDLLPHTPVPRSHGGSGFPWSSSAEIHDGASAGCGILELNRVSKVVVHTSAAEEADDTTALSSSPNSNSGGTSSFQMDIGLYSYRGSGGNNKRDQYSEGEAERSSPRASDDDDVNGNNRKKLRLSKDQSAFLEESFKEHNTLNPKQKQALAKQLNLRPRQVEVWFQNRRARTKLKQTEVDCEYLKRCCETLTEENRRLNKELQELRALKTSNPFYMQLPATTLTMCPSCERVATTTNTVTNPSSTNPTSNNNESSSSKSAAGFPLNRPKFYPFPLAQTQAQAQTQTYTHQSSTAS
ncbi:homeobox-leucine zipper protein HOX11-like [Humulus lupulus]|uniref:homeobox-leucine zipper protein HOX11-like n=1 Tax=Humulus lupulus TaxID=3486 RepID=UPI002B41354C|nr:homeobox-leucine zipper protein HOX11-like [Humulus lupulus]